MNIKLIALSCLLLSFFSINAQERIIRFESDITVHENATINITETIKVYAQNQQIKRGIVREFPTHYKDKRGNNFNIDFAVSSVMLNGKPENYRIENAVNGKRIFIGSPILPPGTYTYTIAYSLRRALSFFSDKDELYFNVTGNGWRLPIDQVIARVNLPSSINLANVETSAYTGSQGQQGTDFSTRILPNNRIEFVSTKPFNPFQGLTISVTWPAGSIQRPTAINEWYLWIRDNLGLFIIWLGVLIMALFYMLQYARFKREQRLSTIIPLFYPPHGFTPGALRYINRMNYDATVLASDVVNMAVHKFLTIDYQKKFLSHEYILKKNQEVPDNAWSEQYAGLFDLLFKKEPTLHVSKSNAATLTYLNQWLQNNYYARYHYLFSWDRSDTLVYAMLGSVCFIIAQLWLSPDAISILAILLLIGMFILFSYVARGYNDEGKKIKAQIEGFRLYLSTAETERMKIIGTPPTKTPELYEEYLPYAIALGCEDQWTKQFAPVFQAMAAQGIVYTPFWFHGPRSGFEFSPHTFASSFTKDMSYSYSNPISSSGSAPGSSSGSGGRGSSGGGSGGGGGGGW